MSNFVKANDFIIAESSKGDLYIFIEAQANTPKDPKIVYDGYEHAIFFRTPEDRIILDYINPEIRDRLRKSKEVVMVETLLGNIKDSYYAGMQMVEKIPVDWSKIGLSTWEEVSLRQQA